MTKDYYKILGIEKNATPEEVKTAFRRLAMQHHPDRGGDTAKFKELNEAYQALGDEGKRRQYDQFGRVFEGGGQGGFGQGVNHAYRQAGVDFGDLGDLFGGLGDLFGARTQTRAQRGGRHVEMDLRVDFKDAVFGAEREVELYKPVRCVRCAGSGGEPGAKVTQCGSCHGEGRVTTNQRTMFGVFQSVTVCGACQGEGKRIAERCSGCAGTGVTREHRSLRVKIPAGIRDGATIRITGEGEAGERGSPAGDLYLTVQVKPDARLQREGDDILSTEPVSFAHAALGTEIEVPTVDGPLTVKIPAGTQPGSVLRLKSRGVPHLRGSGRGDHLVTIAVEVPRKLNKTQKRLLEELRDQ